MLSTEVTLRSTTPEDVTVFFAHQLDPAAIHMAAFTRDDPSDQVAFAAHWDRIRADQSVVIRTIVFGQGGAVAGHMAMHESVGRPEVSYWLGREYWGRGVASAALAQFLDVATIRPLHARVVQDNGGSLRVLTRNGFVIRGKGSGYANGRGAETAEYFLELS